jgi:hypothetical protein
MAEIPDDRRAMEEEALRNRDEVDRAQDAKIRGEHEAAEGVAATAAGALGCLSVAMLPFTVGGLVIVGLIAVFAIRGCTH